jgi:hypothetical protein
VTDFLRRVSADRPSGPGRSEAQVLYRLARFDYDIKATVEYYRSVPLDEQDPRKACSLVPPRWPVMSTDDVVAGFAS